MRFGMYDDVNKEYVITRPDTPLPWINYLGCHQFFSLISNTAGGYCFYRDARLRRLLRYRYNNAPLDIGGRFLYLRDDQSGSTTNPALFWSPTGQPVQEDLDSYECRHGLGYTRIQSEKESIDCSVLYFVPLHENLEIWDVTLTNRRSSRASLSLYGAVEFCLWDAWDDSTNFQRNLNIGEVEVDGSVIYHKSEYRERRNHFAYFACSEPVSGYDTQRKAFLGSQCGWDRPRAVEMGCMSNSAAAGWQPIGAQEINISLEPGEERHILFLLGYFENPAADKFDPPESQTINKTGVRSTISHYLNQENVQAAFKEMGAYWEDLLGILTVNTPDVHTNRMVNTWNIYQVMATFNLSRSASYFESGVGRGIGFRDSNQDLLGFVQLDPERARGRLIDLAATQLENGGAYHQFQPLTKKGNNDIGSNFNDDPLWLVLAVSAYLKETGLWDILDEPVPYDRKPGTEAPLYQHLRKAMQYTLDRIGPHGLPLIGRADWNDCLNLNCYSLSPGQSFQSVMNKEGLVAESVFIAGLFLYAAHEMIGIADHLGHTEDISQLEKACEDFETAVWRSGWDGEWFLRAYDDSGNPIGSHRCSEGQLFIEPQGMCVLAGLGLQNGRAEQALNAVAERLATPHGIMLLQPPYSHYDPALGEITSYPPGLKENGSVFCHTNPWVMIAESMLGHGDRAFDYYSRINPSGREEISDIHGCEPYVYAQTIAGRDSDCPGEAKNSWLTGTAAWNYVALTQWILGIQPSLHGLQITPVLPSHWDGFTARRKYRDVIYQINVKRIGPGNSVQLFLDGVQVEGVLLPLPAEGTAEVEVECLLGESEE
ncbi:MAG: glycosyl transferase [Anaerolineales bacterium]|nr:glycosyl transferase [Anaerolineales bacterium]